MQVLCDFMTMNQEASVSLKYTMKMQPVDLLYRFGESPAIVDYRASWRTFKPKLKKKKKIHAKKFLIFQKMKLSQLQD